MTTAPPIEPIPAFTPSFGTQLDQPRAPEPEPIDRAEQFVRLPTVRTLTANVVVIGRLKPFPLPDLED